MPARRFGSASNGFRFYLLTPVFMAALMATLRAMLMATLTAAFIALPMTAGAAQAGGPTALQRDAQGAVPWWNPASLSTAGAPAPGRDAPVANWSSIGPFGGEIADVAASPVDPNLLLAGLAPANSSGTLFRSVDGGAHWSAVSTFDNNSVWDVEFTPTGTAYVGTNESVWRSTNGGANWTRLQLGIGLNDQVFDVSVDPNTATTLWVGVGDAQGNQTQTVLRSTDGGTTWANRTPPMATPISCKGIAIKRTDSTRIYACFAGAFGGGALWVSTNGGNSWMNRSTGLPDRPMNDVIHDGTRVLVCGGQLFGSQTFGLYASTNDGQNWTPLHAGWPSLVINDIAQDPVNPTTFLVASQGRGVFQSTNNGTSWSYGIGGTGTFPVNSVRFAPGSSSRILLGLNSLGVWQSLDSGTSFNAINTGIAGVNTVNIAGNPVNPQEYAVSFQGANDGGIYTSLDAGQTWELEPLPGTRYTDVVFSPAGALYAISDGPSSIAPEGIYRRNLDGTWTGLGPDQGPLFETELRAFVFSSYNSNLILASGDDFGVAGSEGTVWISTNSGSTWTKTYEGPAGDIVFDVAWVDDGTDMTAVGAVTNFGGAGGALRCTDGGWTWVNSSAGIPGDARGCALSSPPGQPMTFYYADMMYSIGSGGLYKTTNAGLTWLPTGYVGTGAVTDVLCDPVNADNIFIGRPAPEFVLASSNGGATFSPFNTGLAAAGFPNSLGYAAGDVPKLLLSTSKGSFATFLLTAAGLPDGGVSRVSSLAAWPNPSLGGVSFRLPEQTTGAAELRIFDAQGALVRTLHGGRADAGGSLFWDGRSAGGAPVAAGMYWAKLVGNRSEPCTITILR